MKKISIQANISGKVQGVFFRNNTLKKAQSLQLTGWVKNNSDGSVILVACGDQDHIKQLIDWLWQGPSAAEVKNVNWKEVPWQSFEDFKIIYTTHQ